LDQIHQILLTQISFTNKTGKVNDKKENEDFTQLLILIIQVSILQVVIL